MLSPAHSFRLQPQDLPVLSVENETPVLRNFVFELGCFVFEFRQCFGIRFLWVSFLLLPGSTPDMNSRRGWEKIDKQDFLIIVKIKTLGELCVLMCGRFPWDGHCVLQMKAHISVVFNYLIHFQGESPIEAFLVSISSPTGNKESLLIIIVLIVRFSVCNLLNRPYNMKITSL